MTVKPIIFFIVMSSLLIGCGDKAAVSWCKDHANTHQLHQSDITQVNIDYSEQGQIVTKIKIARDHAQHQILANMIKIIKVEADKVCKNGRVDISEDGIYYHAIYHLNCGVDNKLKKVSVSVLDHFKTVDEVEVAISTPSSAKHFVLSRQCDGPIFNL